MTDFLNAEFLGNPGAAWLVAIGVFLGVLVIVPVVVRVLLARIRAIAKRTENDVDDLVADLLYRTKGVLIALFALWAGSVYLELPTTVDEWLGHILVIGILIQAAYWANALIDYALDRYKKKQIEEDPGIVTALGAIGFLVKVGAFSVIALMALANVGIEIGPLVASLGIGGIAIALALQNVLGDLFASISIVFDKPFLVGDFIQVGAHVGTVEHVGLKTSRVRALTGEQLVINNSDLLGARIQNYGRLHQRRIQFDLGVEYGTPKAKLEKIPGIVRGIIESKPDLRFDRCFFREFGDSALTFDVAMYVEVPDYAIYTALRQEVNFEIYEAFENEGIAFAFPTRTVHVQQAD